MLSEPDQLVDGLGKLRFQDASHHRRHGKRGRPLHHDLEGHLALVVASLRHPVVPIHRRTQREEEAVNRFKRLIEEDPASYKIIEEIGLAELEERSYKSAAIFLKLAAQARAKVGADDARVYYNIGVSLYNLRKEDRGKIDEAISYYQKALDITPNDADTVFNILVAYAAKEDWSDTAQWGEKYVSLNSGDPNGWKLLARSYTELGEEEKAAEALKRYDMLKQP